MRSTTAGAGNDMNPFEFPTDIADREVYGRAVAALREGIALADFDRRKDQRFWTGLRDLVPI